MNPLPNGESSESTRKRKLKSLESSSVIPDDALVYFQLVDKNGQPLRGPLSFLIKDLNPPDIQRLLIALVEFLFTKSFFENVTLPDVRVYKSQQEFENRAEGGNVGQPGGPLENSDRIVVNGVQELGLDEDHPLWVVLPVFYKPPPRNVRISELKSPMSVAVPAVAPDVPPFTAPEGWLDKSVEIILEKMNEQDHHLHLVAPMALIRCSQGGKTRALLELGREFKAKWPGTAVIYVSFNYETQLQLEELSNPIAALCRRIAFAASDGKLQFKDNYDFAEQNLLTWLSGTPCILLIDELNLLQNAFDENFAAFLKDNFFAPKARYLVFSSYLATTVDSLSLFLSRWNSRQVVVPELPIIQSLEIAQRNFNYPGLSARELIYYGCIPGLIVEARYRALANGKRRKAIAECKVDYSITDAIIKKLLSTFISGDYTHVMTPLLILMDSWSPVGGDLQIQWIPYHIVHVFRDFADETDTSISTEMREHLGNIVSLFNSFVGAKENSGDGWESLFVLTLLIRCVSEEFDHDFVRFRQQDHQVSFNSLFVDGAGDFNSITKNSQLVEMIPAAKSGTKNHIAIYYPPYAQFEVYDVIVAYFNQYGNRALYGFQLKEGSAVPKSEPLLEMTKSFVVRGNPPDEEKLNKKWHVASDAEIDQFFGHSGQQWTPKNWRRLRGD